MNTRILVLLAISALSSANDAIFTDLPAIHSLLRCPTVGANDSVSALAWASRIEQGGNKEISVTVTALQRRDDVSPELLDDAQQMLRKLPASQQILCENAVLAELKTH